MAFGSTNCQILLLPNELVAKLCSYLTPDAVYQLEQTCSELQDKMNQEIIWKKQVESFPVQGIPFGDSSEATYSKLRRRWDYFNYRLLKFFSTDTKVWHEEFGWKNPYRVALRVKFTIDKLLGDVQNFVEEELDEALGKMKEEANLNPDRDGSYIYPLKIWQVKVELDHSGDWDYECRDYLLKWMVHAQIIPHRNRIDSKLYNHKNVFTIESYMYHENLMKDESGSESENDSSDDGEEENIDGSVDGNHDSDDSEEENIEDSDDDNQDTNDGEEEENINSDTDE